MDKFKILIISVLIWSFNFVTSSYGQDSSKYLWMQFENAPFKEVFLKEYGSLTRVLDKSKSHDLPENEIITISGYWIPVGQKDVIVLSKFPYAKCFFCGGAGIESIIEVKPKNSKKYKFKVDDKITFRGQLVLNDQDWQRAWFILNDAELIK
jgi:uncharacterized membrane protein (UPF0127 family)